METIGCTIVSVADLTQDSRCVRVYDIMRQTIGSVSSGGGLADDKLIRGDTISRNLENGGLREVRRRGSQKTVALVG